MTLASNSSRGSIRNRLNRKSTPSLWDMRRILPRCGPSTIKERAAHAVVLRCEVHKWYQMPDLKDFEISRISSGVARSRWSGGSVQPVRLRPGIYVSYGLEPDRPRPDLVAAGNASARDAGMACVEAMEPGSECAS